MEARVGGLLTVHSMLSATKWNPLNLSELCHEVVSQSLKGTTIDEKCTISIEQCSHTVDSDLAHNLTLVLNELATNSYKHALKEKPNVNIQIRFAESSDDKLILTYTDNGPGYPDAVLQGKRSDQSIGMELIEGIVVGSMRGSVKHYNNEGAVTEICISGINNHTNQARSTA